MKLDLDAKEKEAVSQNTPAVTPDVNTSENIDRTNANLLAQPHNRLPANQQKHADAAWDFLALLNLSDMLSEEMYKKQIMYVKEIHAFRQKVETLYGKANQAKSESSTVTKMVVKVKQHIDEAKAEGKGELEIKEMQHELQELELESDKNQKTFKMHILNLCNLLQEYRFTLTP